MRTAQEIIDETNELARRFYGLQGYKAPLGYRFDRAKHPHERACWAMACEAQSLLTETDVEDAMQEVEDEPAQQKTESEPEEEKPETGWGNPVPYEVRAKFHYFANGRSLCGKWGRFGRSFSLEEGNDEHPDNCAGCKKKIAKYRAASPSSNSAA